MKKLIRSILLAAMLVTFCSVSAFAASKQLNLGLYNIGANAFSPSTVTTVGLNWNGEELYTDVPGFLVDGRTLVPIRCISETLGAEVSWNQTTRQASIITEDKEIILTIGSAYALVNGVKVSLPDGVSASLAKVDGSARTVVPLRFVSEQLGADVQWDSKTYTAYIATQAAADNAITSIYSDDQQQQIIIDTTAKPNFKVFTLSNRIVIDILGAVLEGPASGTMTFRPTFFRHSTNRSSRW